MPVCFSSFSVWIWACKNHADNHERYQSSDGQFRINATRSASSHEPGLICLAEGDGEEEDDDEEEDALEEAEDDEEENGTDEQPNKKRKLDSGAAESTSKKTKATEVADDGAEEDEAPEDSEVCEIAPGASSANRS